MDENCRICVETFNKTTRKKITCFHCNIDVCLNCCKIYLLSSKEESHCMDCKKAWDRMFLANNFPKSWIHNEYKKHREDLIEERHNAILHTYQIYIVSKKRAENYNKEINKIDNQINNLRKEKRKFERWEINENNFINGITDVQPEPREILEMRIQGEDIKKIEEEAKEKRESLIRQRGPCPKINCKGFISDGWKCGICDSKICKSCMLDITDNDTETNPHECKEEDKLSIKQIREDSKNCPQCRVRIFKTEGCYLMWCTCCHVFFDWNTLKIVRQGMHHNPHYLEYINNNRGATFAEGQAIEGICGQRNIDYTDLRQSDIYSVSENLFRKNLNKELREVYETMESNQAARNENIDNTNKTLGILYLENRITKEERKHSLQKRQKELDKLNDTLNVRELWCDQVYTYIYNYSKNNSSMRDTKKGVETITEYCENSMKDIGSWYNSKAPNLKTVRYYNYYH